MKNNELKTGIVLSYAGLVLNIAITLIYTPFLLRRLGQSEYGLYSLVNSVVANLAILDLGFGNAIVKYTAKYRTEQNYEKEKSLHFMFFVLYCAIGLLAFVIGVILILNVKNIFSVSLTSHEISTSKILMLIAVINISLAFPLGVFAAVIQAYERFVFLRSINLVRIFLNPAAIVLVLLSGYRSVGVLLASAVIGTIINIINVFYYYHTLGKRITFSKFDFTLLKSIAVYSFFIFLNIIVDRLYWATDQLILGIFAGTAAVSVYTVGAQFFNYYMQISTSISGIFLPRVVEMDTKYEDERRLSDLFIKVGRIQFIILSFVLCGFALFGREFIAIWAGKEYLDAYYVALIVMTTSIIPLSQNIGISIVQAKNKHAFRSVSYIFIAIFNVILSVILVKPYGVVGCAAATGIAGILGQIIIMNIYYGRVVRIDIPGYWKNVLKLALPAVICLLGGITINSMAFPFGLAGLMLKIAAFSVFFALIMWLLGFNAYEKNLLLSPLMKLKVSR